MRLKRSPARCVRRSRPRPRVCGCVGAEAPLHEIGGSHTDRIGFCGEHAFAAFDTAQPGRAHEATDLITTDRSALPPQEPMHLPHSVDAIVLGVQARYLAADQLIRQGPGGRRPAFPSPITPGSYESDLGCPHGAADELDQQSDPSSHRGKRSSRRGAAELAGEKYAR